MKIRNGFVSNSSTSSFIVAGFYLPKDMKLSSIARKVFGKDEYFPEDITPEPDHICDHKITENKFCPECGLPTWRTVIYDYEDQVAFYLRECQKDFKLKYIKENNFIGIVVNKFLDHCSFHETLIKFEEIENKTNELKKVFGLPKDLKMVLATGQESI